MILSLHALIKEFNPVFHYLSFEKILKISMLKNHLDPNTPLLWKNLHLSSLTNQVPNFPSACLDEMRKYQKLPT